jgi:hypothetical protein
MSTNAQITLALQKQDVLELRRIAMTMTNVQLIHVTHKQVAPTRESNVMITTHVPMTAAIKHPDVNM